MKRLWTNNPEPLIFNMVKACYIFIYLEIA